MRLLVDAVLVRGRAVREAVEVLFRRVRSWGWMGGLRAVGRVGVGGRVCGAGEHERRRGRRLHGVRGLRGQRAVGGPCGAIWGGVLVASSALPPRPQATGAAVHALCC